MACSTCSRRRSKSQAANTSFLYGQDIGHNFAPTGSDAPIADGLDQLSNIAEETCCAFSMEGRLK